MILLNFSHPLLPEHLAQIEALTGATVREVRGEMPQFDHDRPFDEQVRALVERVGLSPEAWQTTPLLVHLPGYAPAAAVLLAELHGRTGHFPAMLRLRPLAGSTPTRYEVAEVLNLQAVREAAREERQG
jgi:transposase